MKPIILGEKEPLNWCLNDQPEGNLFERGGFESRPSRHLKAPVFPELFCFVTATEELAQLILSASAAKNGRELRPSTFPSENGSILRDLPVGWANRLLPSTCREGEDHADFFWERREK
jgi:hypothetical protein